MEIKYSAEKLAELLIKSGADVNIPTDDQIAIIESLHEGPSLIIAGAGSGKTETMSARVIWLVANGFVTPDQVLGLTFTRKAAGELTVRIRKRLRQLKRAGALPDPNIELSANVSTYHSYAGKVLSEHAIRIGIDVSGEPLGEAAVWQLASNIVNNYSGDMSAIEHGPDYIVKKLLSLIGQIGEHGVELSVLEEISREWVTRFESIPSGNNEAVRKAKRALQERLQMLPLVKEFEDYRVKNGVSTFDDQMAWAAKLMRSEFATEIAKTERAKYKIVLLDEYQDTSYSQVSFLSGLFGTNDSLGSHRTTAVGDPNQSIYGWRSASAGTISAFPTEFGGAAKTERFNLMTTWRNSHAVLGLANQTIENLKEMTQSQSQFQMVANSMESVGKLVAREHAPVGEIAIGQYETLSLEANAIADYFAEHWFSPERLAKPAEKQSSFAVLVRTKKYISEIEQALRAQNIPTEVVGLGGLIHVPEVADLIALVRVLIQPDAGSALARLLSGPHFALGAKDLKGLGKFIGDLARANGANPTDTFIDQMNKGITSAMEKEDFAFGSAIDALDQIASAPKNYFSKVGYDRLSKLSRELASLRRRVSGSLIETLLEAERYLFLDSEVVVNNQSAIGRKHLDQFLDEASKFARNGGTLNSFLDWLKIADEQESGIKVSSVNVTNQAVQILTIHAAKGLEWDFVAVPGLVDKHFPNAIKEYPAWTTNLGEIPIELRGDRKQLVDFNFPQGQNAARVGDALQEFKSNLGALILFEEYRLAYVAFTRAKNYLLCTSSWFGTATEPVEPSELFTLVSGYIERNPKFGKILNVEIKPDSKNPAKGNPRNEVWPKPNPRQEVVAKSVAFVKSSEAIKLDSLKNSQKVIFQDAYALINEVQNRSKDILIPLPTRLSVSTLVNLKADPGAVALNIRRPVPNHIDKYARRGTEFHLWIEKRYKDPQIFDDEIFDMPLKDSANEDLPLKELQDKWLQSEWAQKTPVPGGIEVPFETVVSGVLLRGRIDAVYKEGEKYIVVDWKTGKVKSGDDLESAAIQLAMYRLAYGKLFGIPVENISAAFHYVGSNETVRPADLFTQAQLEELITSNLAS